MINEERPVFFSLVYTRGYWTLSCQYRDYFIGHEIRSPSLTKPVLMESKEGLFHGSFFRKKRFGRKKNNVGFKGTRGMLSFPPKIPMAKWRIFAWVSPRGTSATMGSVNDFIDEIQRPKASWPFNRTPPRMVTWAIHLFEKTIRQTNPQLGKT